jgi:hypothetical protein
MSISVTKRKSFIKFAPEMAVRRQQKIAPIAWLRSNLRVPGYPRFLGFLNGDFSPNK